jgi:hypothetical protein
VGFSLVLIIFLCRGKILPLKVSSLAGEQSYYSLLCDSWALSPLILSGGLILVLGYVTYLLESLLFGMLKRDLQIFGILSLCSFLLSGTLLSHIYFDPPGPSLGSAWVPSQATACRVS